jgi:hypothetical protein
MSGLTDGIFTRCELLPEQEIDHLLTMATATILLGLSCGRSQMGRTNYFVQLEQRIANSGFFSKTSRLLQPPCLFDGFLKIFLVHDPPLAQLMRITISHLSECLLIDQTSCFICRGV